MLEEGLGFLGLWQGLLRWYLILLDELAASQAFEQLMHTGEYLAAGARASYSCWSHTF